MKCPCCGAADLVHDTRDLPYIYKGKSTTIPAVTGDHCPACGEVLLNRDDGDRYIAFIESLHQQADTAMVDSQPITNQAPTP